MRAVLLVGLLIGSVAHAGDGVRRARDGRIVTYTAAASVGVGAVLPVVGASIRGYNPNVPWYDKGDYDARYAVRLRASDALLITGAAVGGAHVPLLMTGVLLESTGLRRLDRGHPVLLGWLGAGLVVGAATATPAAFAGPVGAGALIGMAGVGYGLLWAQLGVNEATVRHLPDDVRSALRRIPPRRVRVVAAPWLLGDGAGAVLSAAW